MEYSDDIVLETERLKIKPLSYDELLLYVKLDNSLEKRLGLNPHSRSLPDELKEALEQLILPQVADSGDNILFSTLWTIIDKQKKLMVGDMCFKGVPNTTGEVEIGYGTYAAFQGQGFMTEAVRAISHWALSQAEVQTILAETSKENIYSHKTLSRNGFKAYEHVENMIWWRLDKEKNEDQKISSANKAHYSKNKLV